MRHIPDLRHTKHEITLEHCYVLLAKLGETMDQVEGVSGFAALAEEVNPELMKDHFEDRFQPDEFSRLFQTEIGKGVLVGVFAEYLLAQAELLEDEE